MRHAVGDTPYWQPVQECSAVGANHGRAPESEPPERRGGGFFIKLDFMFRSRKKAAATSNLYRIAVIYRSPPGETSHSRRTKPALHTRDSVSRVKS